MSMAYDNRREKEVQSIVSAKSAFEAIFGKPYKRKLPFEGKVERPICVCCGKPYGSPSTVSHSQTISVKPEPYRGNMVLVEEEMIQWGASTEDAQAMLIRTTWDGKSYSAPYSPFCTLRCALSFARKAYDSGWRK